MSDDVKDAVTAHIDELLRAIAEIQLWQDVYPDGPDIMSGDYRIKPSHVRAARAYVAALKGSHQ